MTTGAATIGRTAPPGASETAVDAGFTDAGFSDAGFARVAAFALSGRARLRVFADRVFAGCMAGSPRAIFAAGLALAIFAGRRAFAPPFIFATHNTLPLVMWRVCRECKTTNRIPVHHLADTGKCGKCHAALPPSDAPIDVSTTAQFDEIVAGARVPLLVDFWAAWCGPCRVAAPEVKKAAHSLAGKAIVLKVDTESLVDLARRFRIASIPNFAVFRDGRLVRQRAGVIDAHQLERFAVASQ